jgi:homoserine kinase
MSERDGLSHFDPARLQTSNLVTVPALERLHSDYSFSTASSHFQLHLGISLSRHLGSSASLRISRKTLGAKSRGTGTYRLAPRALFISAEIHTHGCMYLMSWVLFIV